MKNNLMITVVLLLSVFFALLSSCKPPPSPTPPPPLPTSITDIDGNKYSVRRFGNTLWMTENLRVTRYDTHSSRYGDIIVEAIINQPVNINQPYYKNMKEVVDSPYTDNFSSEIRNSLGLLYNWSAAMGMEMNDTTVNGKRQGICPNGWRLPDPADWDSLCKFFGGRELAGDKFKSMYGWYMFSGNNESGMNCYPAGLVVGNLITEFTGRQTMFWCPSKVGTKEKAEVFRLFYNEKADVRFINKYQASSVRCVMDIKLVEE
jgi:uncharacterized protein (TIGR02145 family)